MSGDIATCNKCLLMVKRPFWRQNCSNKPRKML